MLPTYLNGGFRDYGAHPILPYERGAWEFQAIIDGAARATFRTGATDRLVAHRLCLFGPRNAHGWSAAGPAGCEVIVFHFPELPDSVGQRFNPNEAAETPLAPKQASTLRSRLREARQWKDAGGTAAVLFFDELRALLCRWVIHPGDPPEPARRRGISAADVLAWLSEHLHEGVGVEEAAREFKVSPQHLRRLFHAQRSESPVAALRRLRINRAKSLLAARQHSVESIAYSCGYNSAEAFSRAFRAHAGTSPLRWRRENAHAATTILASDRRRDSSSANQKHPARVRRSSAPSAASASSTNPAHRQFSSTC